MRQGSLVRVGDEGVGGGGIQQGSLGVRVGGWFAKGKQWMYRDMEVSVG